MNGQTTNSNMNPETEPTPPAKKPPPPQPRSGRGKTWIFLAVGILFALGLVLARHYLNLDYLAQQDTRLRSFFETDPWLMLAIAFSIYVLVAALSIPGSTFLSLAYAWFFGFLQSLILISFASTLGATLAFLLSRYLFRDQLQRRFGARLKTINQAFDREGNFYLFMMRLIPVFPFFMVNSLMGLTKIKTLSFWWVSQLGMLGVTSVVTYAGSQIPDLMTLKEEGMAAVFSPGQLIQISIAFALLGIFPFASKKLVRRLQGIRPNLN